MKVERDLEEVLQGAPKAEVAVIVHVDGDPVQYKGAIEALGLEVVRAFRLTNTLALRGPAWSVSQLAGHSWVNKIEGDRRITTQR
jgi:hypothetical protein